MDRLLREGNPPAGQLASPIPQYKKPGVDEYAPVEGQHGAPFAILKDASGAVVSPATEATLEQVRALLSGVATENKLEQARTLLEAISTKDFATSSKQDALNIAVEDLKSELILVKSELANIKANQLSGDQKVQLSGAIMALGKDTRKPEQVSAIVDENGDYVLRVVDAAPFGYDPISDAIRVNVRGGVKKHTIMNAVSVPPGANSPNIDTSQYIDGSESEVWVLVLSSQRWRFERTPNVYNLASPLARSLYPHPPVEIPPTHAIVPNNYLLLGISPSTELTSFQEAKSIAIPPIGGTLMLKNLGEETATITVSLLRRWT